MVKLTIRRKVNSKTFKTPIITYKCHKLSAAPNRTHFPLQTMIVISSKMMMNSPNSKHYKKRNNQAILLGNIAQKHWRKCQTTGNNFTRLRKPNSTQTCKIPKTQMRKSRFLMAFSANQKMKKTLSRTQMYLEHLRICIYLVIIFKKLERNKSKLNH